MSFLYKQMLSNINTEIKLINAGGAALGEGIANLTSALVDEAAHALGVESGLIIDLNILSTAVTGASTSSATSNTLI